MTFLLLRAVITDYCCFQISFLYITTMFAFLSLCRYDVFVQKILGKTLEISVNNGLS
jgi:hypothetical protein